MIALQPHFLTLLAICALVSSASAVTLPELADPAIDRRLPSLPPVVDTFTSVHGLENPGVETREHRVQYADGSISAEVRPGGLPVSQHKTSRSPPTDAAPASKPLASLPIDPTRSEVQKQDSEKEQSKIPSPPAPVESSVAPRGEVFDPLEHAQGLAPKPDSQTGPKANNARANYSNYMEGKRSPSRDHDHDHDHDHDREHDHDHDHHH